MRIHTWEKGESRSASTVRRRYWLSLSKEKREVREVEEKNPLKYINKYY